MTRPPSIKLGAFDLCAAAKQFHAVVHLHRCETAGDFVVFFFLLFCEEETREQLPRLQIERAVKRGPRLMDERRQPKGHCVSFFFFSFFFFFYFYYFSFYLFTYCFVFVSQSLLPFNSELPRSIAAGPTDLSSVKRLFLSVTRNS